MPRHTRCPGLLVALLLAFSSVTGVAAGPPFELTSPDFVAGGDIPAVHTCEGAERSPALHWSHVPAGTRSLALIVDDPDAPDPAAPRITWVHWVLYDLPPATGGLAAGVTAGDLPAGTRQGQSSWQRTGYGGPCPPIGRHRYFHKLYALDIRLGERGALDKEALLEAMQGHVLGRAELIGTYQKKAP